MIRHASISGAMQIGRGAPSHLRSATITESIPSPGNLDVLVSADNRHVWLTISPADARRLAETLLEMVADR